MMNSPEEPYIGNSKQMLQQKNVTARSIIDAGLKSLQTKLRHLQWGRSRGSEENPQYREEATNLSSEYYTEETANQPFTNLTKMSKHGASNQLLAKMQKMNTIWENLGHSAKIALINTVYAYAYTTHFLLQY
jgi:hypothetical protein